MHVTYLKAITKAQWISQQYEVKTPPDSVSSKTTRCENDKEDEREKKNPSETIAYCAL